MSDLIRQEITTAASRIVVKVGTRVLTHADGHLNVDRIASLADQINTIVESGRKVLLVSSGAVGAGMSELGITNRPTDLSQLQAVAAIGQTKLIEAYDQTFHRHGYHAAQVLLTAGDLHDRTSYLNVRNTLLALLDMKAIPIVNENDTVAVDELMTTFGDNDRLAALVTNLIGAPLLVILSDIEGLFDGPPQSEQTKLVSTVTCIDEQIMSFAQDAVTGLSKGGMASKLKAAKMATVAGENVILANGHEPDILRRVVSGECVGTAFLAEGKSVSPWKRWIGFSAHPRGKIVLDDGAQKAVVKEGSSLLAIGILEIHGDFAKGEVVTLRDRQGKEWARGLTNYSDEELRKIKGLRSNQISETLGYCPYEEVVHRNNMVLIQNG
ncbi:MAG: glutamate 5-kinase [Planctomycetaceae bacterium]|nr:glutamate 5-kinase [Planctomycetaceae bacterium]